MITFIGETNFRNERKIFGIKPDDRRRHIYVLGKSGSGKSVLLENMAIQDIRNGNGICFADPHGDSSEKLLKSIPPHRINDVVYFNPSDTECPIAFNPMDSVSDRHLTASGLVAVFKKIWSDSWGPRLEDTLRNTLLALLENKSTLLDVQRMLREEAFRNKIVSNLKDPVVKNFWTKTFAKWNDRYREEAVAPVQNKIGQFISSPLIRNIIGQKKTSFHIRSLMDNKKILIMNLSKGKIGEDNSALLGALMITKIQLSAMERGDIPEEERKDFYLYVDEFQNFATESFCNILSEARKYRLNLILANQYIEQIKEEITKAVFGNCGTIIAFRVGSQDGQALEKELPPFTQEDFINLPRFSIYLKLCIDNQTGQAFSATSLPPLDLEETSKNADKIIYQSRQRYCKEKREVEETIAKKLSTV